MHDRVSSWDKNIVCQYKDNFSKINGLWFNRNPLHFAIPLFLFQLSLISVTSQIIEKCLHPLGQSSIVAQIFGGILYGPSIFGHYDALGQALFPTRSILPLETIASLGIVYFFFAIGVRTDPVTMVRPGRQGLIIGLSAMFLTMLLTVSFSLVLRSFISMDKSLARALPFVAASQCLTPFPNISCLLAELGMLSSDLGRIATTSSMTCDLIGMSLVAVMLGILQSGSEPLESTLSISSAFLFVLAMVFLGKPIVRKVVKVISSGGKSIDENCVVCFLVSALVVAFISEVIGQHFVLGPLVLGLVIPDGLPLGAPLISRLDYMVGKFLYPTFLTTSGLKTNIFSFDFSSFWILMLVIVFSCIAKIGSVMFASHFVNINFQDSVVLGLIMNARGICELIVFNLWRDGGVLRDQEFALCVVSVIAVTAIITPLIKVLYDPSKRHVPLKKRTIQNSKRDAELRIVVCILNQENVPCIVNLLEASDATEHSPIAVIAVVLEELVGRATPMLVAHQSTRTLHSSDSRSGHIINALRQYELCNERCVTIQSFSAISHLQSVHDDICRVALDQNATIVILPFHKHWEIDGSIGSVNKAIQNMNIKVMDTAPCSVGILVDRGILSGSLSILNNQSTYRVAVIYIGGPDDAESLCYGARMSRHNNVTLTVVRYLLFGCDTAKERKQDNNLINEVRHNNMGNENFIYREQVVKDGVGLAASLRTLETSFDLLIVGRNHQASQILVGLGAWSECPELGVVADILASPDFGSTASVLVVQQHTMIGDKIKNRMMKPVVISHESLHHPTTGAIGPAEPESRWEISIDTTENHV
ncbi:cation/H(+) antiporter 15-like [Dorcoceras hygrometricum]|uniref:Cation/H(+) antiporter 15-like n=1 Tax=Dorcoceras hygrometricum TaxID=472368 RepID=A0A2Z7C8V5_9LAMI|nr:cation/H(+) antiporter 15-like [Dorcoceras hygrometricum]